jgi:tetratricopeptide (TPR) repeat protein
MKERYDDLDQYIADLKSEIEGNTQCATHYYNLGLAFLSKRDFVAAEEALLNAVRNSPHLAEAYVQLGGICLERDDLDGCLRYNEEAANCRAKFPVPWSNIAFVHLQRGQPDKAIAALNKALKWNPEFIQAKNGLATACYMKGEFKKCEEICTDIIKQEPAFAPAWNNLALACFDQKNYARAVEAADRARELGFEVREGFLEELKPYRDQPG